MDSKQFKKNLGLIKKGEARFNRIHESAVFALAQINQHGQTTPANQLLGVMHKADRIEALKTWFRDFGKVNTQKDGTLKYVDAKKILWEGQPIPVMEAVEIASSMPYFEYTKEIKPASSYDVMKGLKSILTRAKAMEQHGGTIEHKEMLAKIVALIPE